MNLNLINMLSKLFGKKTTENLSFIFGCPRGGTTWLWSLLESHADVVPFVHGEKDDSGRYVTSESGIYVRKPREARALLVDFCKRHPNKTVIEKTPLHTLQYDAILKDFPLSKHLIILRNPLAVANSMMHSNMKAFEEYDIDKSIFEIKKYYEALTYLCTRTDLLCITYEQMLADTRLVLSKVFDYLALSDVDIQRIIDENKGTTKVLVKGAFRSGKQSSYLNELTEEQRNKLNAALEEEIVFYDSQYERVKDSCCH